MHLTNYQPLSEVQPDKTQPKPKTLRSFLPPPRSGNSGGGATHSSTSALGVVNDVQPRKRVSWQRKRQISKGQRPQRLLANCFVCFLKGTCLTYNQKSNSWKLFLEILWNGHILQFYFFQAEKIFHHWMCTSAIRFSCNIMSSCISMH